MRVAAGLDACSIAFPAISTGIYRWPVSSAAEIALTAIAEASKESPGITSVVVVLFDQRTYDVFDAVAR